MLGLLILGLLYTYLEVKGCFPPRSSDSSSEINSFHITSSIIFYTFLFHFYISCINKPGIRETLALMGLKLNDLNTVHGLYRF